MKIPLIASLFLSGCSTWFINADLPRDPLYHERTACAKALEEFSACIWEVGSTCKDTEDVVIDACEAYNLARATLDAQTIREAREPVPVVDFSHPDSRPSSEEEVKPESIQRGDLSFSPELP